MRLLLFSDLHLDTAFSWASLEVARARRRALRTTLTRICELAAAQGVDALCCAGDLYEQERYTADTAAFLRETFAALAPLPVLIAPGNHDWLGPGSLYAQVSWAANVHIFGPGGLSPHRFAEGVTIWGGAHAVPANTPNFLDGFHVSGAGVHLALFHGSEQGDFARELTGKRPHAPFSADQIPAAGLHHAMVGHFHTPCDGRYHTYAGNPEPLSFGEGGERGAVLLTVDSDGSVRRQRFPVAVSQVHDVEVELTDVAHSAQVRDRVAAAVAGLTGCVRVTLTGSISPDVELDLAELNRVDAAVDGGPQALVVRLGPIGARHRLEVLAAEQSVRGQFVRDVLAATELDEPLRQRVLSAGLRAFDGRTDELVVL